MWIKPSDRELIDDGWTEHFFHHLRWSLGREAIGIREQMLDQSWYQLYD